MSYGVYHLRRGYTFDPECSLSTHRLRRPQPQPWRAS